jgi:hypothetical protein
MLPIVAIRRNSFSSLHGIGRAAPSAPRATRGAWPRTWPTSSIISCRRCRCASGSSRFQSGCAPLSKTTAKHSTALCAFSSRRSNATCVRTAREQGHRHAPARSPSFPASAPRSTCTRTLKSALPQTRNCLPNASLGLACPNERSIPSWETSNRPLTGSSRRRILKCRRLDFLSLTVRCVEDEREFALAQCQSPEGISRDGTIGAICVS